jgi:hypothetical protein
MAHAVSAIAGFVSAAVFVLPCHGEETAPTPDFSGLWARMTFGAEPPRGGAGPLVNLIRRADGASDGSMLVGDYTNGILKPWAAERVKALGEISKTGTAFPDPSNQCAPQSPPYILRQQEIQLLQEQDRVTILYMLDHHVRHVRLNGTHPANVTPSWAGDSIGRYEGDTLVVDTVGIKLGPVTMSDQFGSPQTEAMHVTERYRLVGNETARIAADQNEKEYGRADGANANGVFVDFADKGKGLELEFTVDDPGVFTAPWSATVTYRKAGSQWQEQVCAENTFEYYAGKVTRIPTAAKPDF